MKTQTKNALLLACLFAVALGCDKTKSVTELIDDIIDEYKDQSHEECDCFFADYDYSSPQECKNEYNQYMQSAETQSIIECQKAVYKANKDAVRSSVECGLDAEKDYTKCVKNASCNPASWDNCAYPR